MQPTQARQQECQDLTDCFWLGKLVGRCFDNTSFSC
jgi:hypothetical protein